MANPAWAEPEDWNDPPMDNPTPEAVGELVEALGRIAALNDLSGVPDADVEAAARSKLYECELIARAALDGADR